MAFTSLTNLVTQCAALPVTGVVTQIAYRPTTPNAADLPLLYPRLPDSTRPLATLTYGQDLRQATIEIVILVEYLNLNTQPANDALTVQLLDALAAALESSAEALGMDSYSMTTDEDSVGGAPIQAIIATVEVSG